MLRDTFAQGRLFVGGVGLKYRDRVGMEFEPL